MKKVRKGSGDDSSSAVDVFGGVGVSQEQLLAEALGEPEAPSQTHAPNEKKKKKGKKAGIQKTGDNAVDVFGGAAMSQDELLAGALGDDATASAVTPTPKKKKTKKGKKGAVSDESNAVNVFGGANLSQDELLANALGENEPIPQPRRKGKRGKNGVDFNAADINGSAGNGASEDTLSHPDYQTVLDGGKNDIKEAEEHITDVGRTGEIAAETQLVGEAKSQDSGPYAEIAGEQREQGDDSTDAIAATDAMEDEEVDEDFEPDNDVVSEFEKATKEFDKFTSQGRRRSLKLKRGERNAVEGRLADPKRANFGSGGEKFTSIRLEDVTMTFRNTTVLNGVTWGVKTGERVGLIGENGCGKTTQLRMIAGLMTPTSGELVRSSARTKASFLRQEFIDELDPRRTLREEFTSAFVEEQTLLSEYNTCEKEIADAGDDLDKLEVLLNRLEDLRQKCDDKGAWNLEARIDKVMPGLGFTEDDNDKLVAAFSGGWKVRIGLGKVLLQDPDLLLLDEPSNHLDNESVEWLEAFLQASNLPMVVVSHDREFLDRVCTKIVEIEGGEAFDYPGNYSTYVKLKKGQRKAWEAAYERQQKFIKEQENYIKRNRRTPARSSQVKSREKMLKRMEKTGQLVRRPPRQGKPLVFRFPPAPRSGRDCVIVDEVTHGYEGRALFKDASIAIERGDRIALIGPNGAGKSTLLRMITGREDPQEGTVQCQGLTNIALAYYEQNQADALELDVTVLDTLRQAAPAEMRYEELRALLGKFLFKGDDVEKKVAALSGGEKARLALAKIMLEPSNVLVLDEPGNHLSISAKEMLEEALQNFDGTLLLVSHDRYLISQVATQILAIEEQELVLYDGDYKSYMEKNSELRERLQARFIPGVAEIKNAPKIVIQEPAEMVDKKQKRKKNFGGSGVNSGKTKEMNAKRWNRA